MKVYGLGTISDFLGEFIIYRNLVPMDLRLKDPEHLQDNKDVQPARIPRKLEPAYAEVVVKLLSRARALNQPNTELKSLLYIGDTRMSDGGAFMNLCEAGGWRGLAYICEERDAPEGLEVENSGRWTFCIANRWRYLNEIEATLARDDFQVDEHTVVIIDLDKTALGARGRNDKVINQVRIDAAREMARRAIDGGFDKESFDEAYHLLNRPRFHPLTIDNQDYLAFICLVVASGFTGLRSVVNDFEASKINNFSEFLNSVQERNAMLTADLSEIHTAVFQAHQRGDPTPFKLFRQMEYLKTIESMGYLPGDVAVEEILERRITITQEVRSLAERCSLKGALLFGLSDKPDEASLPSPEQLSQGWHPIHRTETYIVGS